MILIFGGAYQGKLDFAKETFGVADQDVRYCEENQNLDLSGKVICHMEKLFLALSKAGIEPKDFLDTHRETLADKILIVDDISQGVVPLDFQLRAWREATGRAMLYLTKEANQVYRVFCGIGQQIK